MKLSMKLLVLLFGVLMLANVANAESPREQFTQMVEQLQANPDDNALREKIIKLAQKLKPAPAIPEEAERRMVRGTAAFESAKNIDDYENAISEFQAATDAAPWLSNAYYNLGFVNDKAGNPKEAMDSYRLYLLTIRDNKEITEIKKRIYKLEYALEQTTNNFKNNIYTYPLGKYSVSIPSTWITGSEENEDDVYGQDFINPVQPAQKFIVKWYRHYRPHQLKSGRLEMYGNAQDYVKQHTEKDKLVVLGSSSENVDVSAMLTQVPHQISYSGRNFTTFIVSNPVKVVKYCRDDILFNCEVGEYRFSVIDTKDTTDKYVNGVFVLIGINPVNGDQNAASNYKEFVRSFSFNK